MINASCQNTIPTEKSDAKQIKPEQLIKQITQLEEFKLAQKEIDSIKRVSNIPLDISIGIIDSSFLKEDEGKGISLAFIQQQSKYENRILYTIKFDKRNQKIISVERSKEKSKLTDLPLPSDTMH